MQISGNHIHMCKLMAVLGHMKKPLRKLNSDKFADIHNQKDMAGFNLTEIQATLELDTKNKVL